MTADSPAAPAAAEGAETPAFDELRPRLDPIVARYPVRTAAMLPVLWEVQRARGYVSDDSAREVADYLEVPKAHVEGVLTFYTMYYQQPVGRHVVMLCKTLSCHLRGATHLAAAIEERFGTPMGGTTEDGKFTFEYAECLGLCDMAPCLLVGDQRFGPLTPDEALDALEQLP